MGKANKGKESEARLAKNRTLKNNKVREKNKEKEIISCIILVGAE